MDNKSLRGLTVFVQTAMTGSMSKAAEKLDMTASAVSQCISKLEAEVGLGLLNRSTRTLTLTEAGKVYFDSASSILNIASDTSLYLSNLKQRPCGRLKISAPNGFAGGLLSQPLEQLIETYPDIQLDLVLSDEPIDIIGQGIDLAICVGPLQDSSLVARHLATWQKVMCVAHHHPLAKLDIIHPKDLHAHSFIKHKTMPRQKLIGSISGEEFLVPKADIQVNSMNAAIQLTLDGVGYSILPEPEIRHHLASGKLVRICPTWQAQNYRVYALTPERSSLAAKTKVAIECIQNWFNVVSKNQNKH